MKKLVAIILILLAISLAIYSYRININKRNITASEVENIQEFIAKIYLWKEISGEALPEFANINEAPDIWVWEVVKKNLDKYELTYDEVQQKADEIFGENFTKKFPEEGSEYILFDEDLQKYVATGIGLDTLEDMFLIKNITKTNSGYKVEIIEYLEDYGDEIRDYEENEEQEEMQYYIYIKNLNMENVITIKSSENENTKIDKIKENIDKFSIKIIELFKKDGNLYVESVK